MREGQSEQVSDFAIASAVAQAVRAVRGVADLTPGTVALEATYGSGQRVDGVVIHHLSPDEIALEVHVALSEPECKLAVADSAPDASGHAPEASGLLPVIASRIRSAVFDVARGISPVALTRVDVLIDDLR